MLLAGASCGDSPRTPTELSGESAQHESVEFSAAEVRRILTMSPLPPPPEASTNRFADHPAAARLGQWLFFDQQFSIDGQVSCATCHLPEKAFTDGRTLARGQDDLTRHTPSLFNVAYNRWFFWDGRADSLWAQALHPFEEEGEFGLTRLEVIRRVAADPELAVAYGKIFGPLPELSARAQELPAARPVWRDEEHPQSSAWASLGEDEAFRINVAFSNLGKAIAAYERLLISDQSPFDVFVAGLRAGDSKKMEALSVSAQRGLQLFVGEARCRVCHHGPLLSDLEFHSIRIPPLTRELGKDQGRQKGMKRVLEDPFNGVGVYSDDPEGPAVDLLAYLQPRIRNRGEFKTPSLRNVAVTAPYMHQGQRKTLEDVLHHYSKMEEVFDPVPSHFETILEPLHLTEDQTNDLLEFLGSLTDLDLDPDLMHQPSSPSLPSEDRSR